MEGGGGVWSTNPYVYSAPEKSEVQDIANEPLQMQADIAGEPLCEQRTYIVHVHVYT